MLGYAYIYEVRTSCHLYKYNQESMKYNLKKKQPHAVSRTQQGRQREPSVNTFRSPNIIYSYNNTL